MGVYIKGMEMPTSCWDCKFSASVAGKPEACLITGISHSWGLSKPPSDCPLVEVPDGKFFAVKDGIMYEPDIKQPVGAKVFEIPTVIQTDRG